MSLIFFTIIKKGLDSFLTKLLWYEKKNKKIINIKYKNNQKFYDWKLKVDMCEDDYYLEFCSQMHPKINFLLTLHIYHALIIEIILLKNVCDRNSYAGYEWFPVKFLYQKTKWLLYFFVDKI